MATGEMTDAEFSDFLERVASLVCEFSVDGSLHFVCIDWRHIFDLLTIGKRVYSELKNLCVWVKDNGGMGSLYRSQHELIAVFKNGSASHRNNIQLGVYGRYRTNVWSYAGANSFSRATDEGNLLALHPTVKPVALVSDAILDCSAPNDIVFDPFLGSGTTIIAAERTGRIACGIEVDPHYVDTTIRRWQAFTGNAAIHVASGKNFNELEAEVHDVGQ
jgi:DNA modification methylase